jgi:hypothetical protein
MFFALSRLRRNRSNRSASVSVAFPSTFPALLADIDDVPPSSDDVPPPFLPLPHSLSARPLASSFVVVVAHPSPSSSGSQSSNIDSSAPSSYGNPSSGPSSRAPSNSNHSLASARARAVASVVVVVGTVASSRRGRRAIVASRSGVRGGDVDDARRATSTPSDGFIVGVRARCASRSRSRGVAR